MQNIQGRKIFRRCHTHSPDCDPDLTEGGAVSYWIVERWVQVPHAEAGKQKTAHWSSYDIFQKAAFGVLLKTAGKLLIRGSSRLAWKPVVVLMEFVGNPTVGLALNFLENWLWCR